MSKETVNKSDGYSIRRYFTPSPITASQAPKAKKVRAKGWHLEPLTYQYLLDEQTKAVQLKTVNEQTARNRATALRQFLAANKLHMGDVVGDEMRLRHPEAIERFVHTLQADDKSPRSISNTRAAFRPWKDAVVEHDTQVAIALQKGTPFVQAIKGVMANSPVKRVAKLAGVPPDMLRGWLLGKQPRPSSVKFLNRIEGFFGLEQSSLVHLAGIKPRGHRLQLGGSPPQIEYNRTVSALSRKQYWCRPKPGSQLRDQWTDFLKYKTSANPEKKRTKRGKWSFSPCPQMARTETNWWGFLNGKEVAAARMAWAKIASYLGWLALPQSEGGKGIRRDKVESLAWLAVPDYLEEYLEWSKARIGHHNQGTIQFLAQIASVVRPRQGYLWQSPELQTTLPKQFANCDWQDLCERQFETQENLTSSITGETVVSRDSFEPIREIVELPQPMDAVADMLQRMQADRPIGRAATVEALWGRDIALIKLLLSNPLRKANISHLTWRPDNSGELYQRGDGSWWIRIPKHKFKNRKGAAGDKQYDCEIQPFAWPAIERYLFVYRPTLQRSPTDLVFLTRLLGNNTIHQPWTGLDAMVRSATNKYVVRSPGFGPHAFRHIVASSILKAPGGTHRVAANVLNDRVATVEKHYDGLTSNDGSRDMARLLGPQFNRM